MSVVAVALDLNHCEQFIVDLAAED